MSYNADFYFKPVEGTHIETKISLAADTRSAICGTVTADGEPVSDALVVLFKAEDKEFIDRQFTDKDGQFFFGPLVTEDLYHVKIHKSKPQIRELE